MREELPIRTLFEKRFSLPVNVLEEDNDALPLSVDCRLVILLIEWVWELDAFPFNADSQAANLVSLFDNTLEAVIVFPVSNWIPEELYI